MGNNVIHSVTYAFFAPSQIQQEETSGGSFLPVIEWLNGWTNSSPFIVFLKCFVNRKKCRRYNPWVTPFRDIFGVDVKNA